MTRRLPTLLVVLVLLPALAGAGPEPGATTLLPRDVRPTHYDVTITPDAPALRFDGHAGIDVELTQPTPTITLNALELELGAVRVAGRDGGAPRTPRVSTDARAQTATFTFDEPLAPGRYRLEIDYTGRIGTQAVGLFAVDYPTPGGQRRALYTQFEASDARRMVPCWDEPAYKATFTLTAVVPEGQMAVGNMPARATTSVEGGRRRVEFGITPRMSSYLLFLAVGDFERATVEAAGAEIGVVTQRGKLDQAAFALAASPDIVRELEDYFGIPYPLPKLDNVAAPGRSQFFGAMENWGAIFTFEYALLVDPAISTASDRQSIFRTAAHEIAHQWFGDLVTMSWWDDLWLNEGFASWMAGRITERLHPEWKPELRAVLERDAAMERDALSTTHPVVQRVETMEQASQAFDAITYKKGEAVIRMLEGWVGEEDWRNGVRRYLQEHAYGNTISDDLWEAIADAGGRPITSIAHEFTLRPGVPLITVEEATCVDGRTRATLVQRRFEADGPSGAPGSWSVPVLARTLDGATERVLVTGGRATLTVEGCGPLLVNAGQSGYFRTRYAPDQLGRLLGEIARVPAADQLGVLTDTWALGEAGEQPLTAVLDVAAALPADALPQVLSEVVAIVEALDTLTAGMPARRTAFRTWARARLRPIFERVGWTAAAGEGDAVAILRNDLIRALGALGDAAVVAEARRRWDAQVDDPSSVPGPLRKAILGVVARHADAASWERLRETARAETTPLVRDQLYRHLSAAEDEALARRALELAMTDEPGVTNSAEMIAEVAVLHPDLAFDFAMAHIALVDERVDATSRSRYYASLATTSADPATIDDLRSYAERHLTPDARGDVETAIARIRHRVRFRQERLPVIDAWLAGPRWRGEATARP